MMAARLSPDQPPDTMMPETHRYDLPPAAATKHAMAQHGLQRTMFLDRCNDGTPGSHELFLIRLNRMFCFSVPISIQRPPAYVTPCHTYPRPTTTTGVGSACAFSV